MLNIERQLGIGLTVGGLVFTLLGILFLFDQGLLAFGNILLLGGVSITIGIGKTFVFFFQMKKIKGTSCFLGGIFLVLIGWPFVGMCIEVYGFLGLFGDFFPTIIMFLRQIPFLGPLLSLPGIRTIVDSIGGDKLSV
jgi:hypothetical protein